MEHKIGEKFKQGNVTLKVLKEDENHWCCMGCYYNHGALSDCFCEEILENRGECRKGRRSDLKGVIFKEAFISKNMKQIIYISILLFTVMLWYFIFKMIFGL